MNSSNFYTFLALFSYETIAFDFLLAGIFVAILSAEKGSTERWRMLCVGVPILFATAISHHLTSWVAVLLLSSTALAALLRGNYQTARATAAIAAAAILAVGVWMTMAGTPVHGYLGPILALSLNQFIDFLWGSSNGRQLFVGADGAGQPIPYRLAAILSVVLISTGLVIGFFRALGLPGAAASPPGRRRRAAFLGTRDNAWAVVLTVSTFAYPLSIALRLTSGGWELGNRMSAFVFLGVGLVVAVGAVKVLITPDTGRVRVVIASLALGIFVAGGVIAELPPNLIAIPYRPAADGASIEPMGIGTAKWTRDWLGGGWRFASDRANRLLLATHGVQRIVTLEQDGAELGEVLFDEKYTNAARHTVRVGAPDFLLVDLRLTSGRPQFGYYFGPGEDPALHQGPPLLADLVKFDDFPNVGRVYDNGYEVIYDVRNLPEEEPRNVSASSGEARVDVVAPGSALTQRIDARAAPGSSGDARVNYDAGVLRHVAK
jgi:hypothetical protein